MIGFKMSHTLAPAFKDFSTQVTGNSDISLQSFNMIDPTGTFLGFVTTQVTGEWFQDSLGRVLILKMLLLVESLAKNFNTN